MLDEHIISQLRAMVNRADTGSLETVYVETNRLRELLDIHEDYAALEERVDDWSSDLEKAEDTLGTLEGVDVNNPTTHEEILDALKQASDSISNVRISMDG